jgi:hypothetical protein
MSREEFNEYIKSIGGLENGYFTDRPPLYNVGSVGDGWLGLLKDLIEDLIKLGWNKQILQIKEKFGGLRFYINGASVEIHDRIRQAEEESYRTCEECGKPGEARKGGWIKTLCDNCNE